MKKLIAFLSLMAFALLAWGQTQTVHASQTTTLMLHKRIYRDARLVNVEQWEYDNQGQEVIQSDLSLGLNGANFDVYDATTFYDEAKNANESEAEFAQRLAQLDRKSALALAQAHNLQTVATLKTATVDGEDGVATLEVSTTSNGRNAAYLLIETSVDADTLLNVDLTKKSAPIYLRLPARVNDTNLNPVHLYPKNVGYVRDPFFFKYGKQLDGTTKRLKGVTFALYQVDQNGQKLYLDSSPVFDLKNSWITTDDPLNNVHVAKFTSDANGLVDSGERFLPAGTYYFEELQALDGYVKTEETVEVVVPASWYDDDGNYLPVTINGEVMEETLSGVVKEETIQKGRPRIFNTQISTTSTTDPKPTTPTQSSPSSSLPSMGTAMSWLAVIIGLTLMIAARFWLKKPRQL